MFSTVFAQLTEGSKALLYIVYYANSLLCTCLALARVVIEASCLSVEGTRKADGFITICSEWWGFLWRIGAARPGSAECWVNLRGAASIVDIPVV